MKRTPAQSREHRYRLVALGVATLVCSVVLEAGLRWAIGPPIHWRFPQEGYRPDERVGYRLQPLQSAFTHEKPVRTNSMGLRDREYSDVPPPGTVRILAVGDSQTFGLGLALEETWPKQLESQLRDQFPSTRWEVVNAGLPGSDAWQHEALVEELMPRLRPGAIILAFYINDVTPAPDVRMLKITAEDHWTRRITFALKRSALITALLGSREAARALLGMPSGSYRREDLILSGKEDENLRRGWRQVERSLAAMAGLARDAGGELRLIVLPRRDQVTGEIDGRAYQTTVMRIGEQLGLTVIDVLEPLRAAYATHGRALFIEWDGHNSALANRVIARAVIERDRGIGSLQAGTQQTPEVAR